MANNQMTTTEGLEKSSSTIKKSKIEKGENITGFLFVSPMLLGISVIVLFPIVATFILAFADWKFVTGIDQLKWVGFDNFVALAGDEKFIMSVINNAIFILTVPITMICALFLAVIIDKNVYLK